MPSSALPGIASDALFAPHSSDVLTLEDAARMMREAVKNKAYRATMVGGEVARFLRWMRAADYSARSYYEYESVLYRFAIEHADLELSDFEPPVGVERIEEWIERHWMSAKPGTRRKVLSILGSFFKWATERQRIQGNPMVLVRRPKRRKSERRAHPATRVLDIIRAQHLRRDQCGVMLLGMMGLRKNELRLLQIKDIDLELEQVRLNQKGGDVVYHPIVFNDVLAKLAEHFTLDGRNPDEYLLHPRWERTLADGTKVFQREDRTRPMSQRGLHEWWARALERAGVGHFPMHEMRHTAGTEFHRAVHDLELTRQFMRHKSIMTTSDVYMHLDREDLTRAMLKAAERWEETES